jgi:hypothetical protein
MELWLISALLPYLRQTGTLASVVLVTLRETARQVLLGHYCSRLEYGEEMREVFVVGVCCCQSYSTVT